MSDSTYIVIDTDLIINDMIIESTGSESTPVKSLNGASTILEFTLKHPNTMAGFLKYTHEGIIQYLVTNSGAWTQVV